MNKKLLGVVALVVVLFGVWWLWIRDGSNDETTRTDDGSAGRSGEIANARHPQGNLGHHRSGNIRWALDLEPDGPIRLEGQVLGPDNAGVGGAIVWIDSKPPRSVRSDDDGSFHFDKLVGRMYTLTATRVAKDSYLISGVVHYKLAPKSDPAIIHVSPGAAVAATVVDDTAQPIRGARVQSAGQEATATTDDKGTAMLRPVRPGYVTIQATASGYAPNIAVASVGTAKVTDDVTITLHKGFPVSGRVIDEAGKPIANAHVYASGGQWTEDRTPDDAGDDDASDAEVVSDEQGTFTIPALANGPHTLAAVDGEHAPASAPVMVRDQAVTRVDLVMKSGGAIRGRVVSAKHEPVAFAIVRVAGTGSQMWNTGRRQAVTDKDGKFELRGLVRTKLQARAESDNAASEVVPIDLTAKKLVDNVELVLDQTGTIAGIVVDDAGQPLPEISVQAFPDILGGASTEALALTDMSSTTTDGGGEFEITGLPEGAYKVWATRGNANGRQWGQQGTAAKTGDTKLRLVLAAAGKLVGKVEIEGVGTPKLAFVHVGYRAGVPITNGSFEVGDLNPGKYHVRFRGADFAEMSKDGVEIVAGKTTDLGTVKLYRGRRLVGKVVDSSGTPVPNAKIKLAEILFTPTANEEQAERWEDIAGWRTTVSDQDGEFALIGVPTKRTNVMADSPQGRSVAVVVPEGNDDPPPVTLTLHGFGSISGTVTLKGEPQPGVTVTETSKGGGAQAAIAQTDEKGHFELPKVPAGTHVLQAMQSRMMAFKSTSVTVDVREGVESKVAIDIPVGQISLTVQIKAAPGAKVDGAQVFLFAGSVAVANAKQLTDSVFQGAVQGMKIWFGGALPMPEFDELLAGNYSICTVPITGNLADPAFQQQLQANVQALKVYCRKVTVTPSPDKQTIVQQVPGMVPLPS